MSYADTDANADGDWYVSTLIGPPPTNDDDDAADALPASIDGPASEARFASASRIEFDARANRLFVTDQHRIRVVTFAGAATAATATAASSAGSNATPEDDTEIDPEKVFVRTLVGGDAAGSVDSPSITTAAASSSKSSKPPSFCSPSGLAFDASSGILYVADTGNNTIRALLVSTGRVWTVAGSAGQSGYLDGAPGSHARFSIPAGVCLDAPRRARLFVSDQGNNAIRAISLATAEVKTFAGPQSSGQFASEYDHTTAAIGTTVTGPKMSTAAGAAASSTAAATAAAAATTASIRLASLSFASPTGVTLAGARGNQLLIVELAARTGLRCIDLDDSTVRTIPAAASADIKQPAFDGFNHAIDAAYDPVLNVCYVVESGAGRIVAIDEVTGLRRVIAGGNDSNPRARVERDGIGSIATFESPDSITVDSSTGTVFVLSANRLRVLTPSPALRALRAKRLHEIMHPLPPRTPPVVVASIAVADAKSAPQAAATANDSAKCAGCASLEARVAALEKTVAKQSQQLSSLLAMGTRYLESQKK